MSSGRVGGGGEICEYRRGWEGRYVSRGGWEGEGRYVSSGSVSRKGTKYGRV